MKSPRHPSTILSLPANVSEPDALGAFRSHNASSIWWRLAKGPLLRIAPAYLPFCLHCVTYELGRTHHRRFFAIDQVEGVLDLFEFPDAVNAGVLVLTKTRNQIAPVLSEERAQTLLRDKVLRMIFLQGFFRLRHPNLEIGHSISHFYIPYWLGFYGQEGNLRFRVLDAMRKRMEGEKARLLFERWLAA